MCAALRRDNRDRELEGEVRSWKGKTSLPHPHPPAQNTGQHILGVTSMHFVCTSYQSLKQRVLHYISEGPLSYAHRLMCTICDIFCKK